MENNYNFNINPKEPSSDDIRRHMDFDALLNELEQSPKVASNPIRLRRIIYITGVAAAAILILFLPNLFNTTTLDADKYFARQAFINPPIPAIKLKETVKTIADVHQGGVIEYASGSRIVVPSSAFMNDRGRLIGGEVNIHYKELNDFVDFFVAGIQMNYDSLGLQRYLNSSGMIEIYAEQNGQRLELAPGKAIQIELVSEVKVDDYFMLPSYNVYQLNTEKRNWEYKNIDILQFFEDEEWPLNGQLTPQQQWQQQLVNLNESYQEALADLQLEHPLPIAPYKPSKAKGDRPSFELDFQNGTIALDPLSQVQQIDIDRLHNGTIWEMADNSPSVDPNAFRVVWESVRLKKLNNQQYELTLIHSQNEETLIVEPVLFGSDFQQAMDKYHQNLQTYNQAVAEREKQIEISREGLQQLFNDKKVALQLEFKNSLNSSNEQLKRKLIHRFIINEFGIWACGEATEASDTPQNISLVDQQGQPFEAITAYVVNKDQNTLYCYMAKADMPVELQPQQPTLLWVVNDEGQISISTIESNDAEGNRFQLNPIKSTFKSADDLRQLMDF